MPVKSWNLFKKRFELISLLQQWVFQLKLVHFKDIWWHNIIFCITFTKKPSINSTNPFAMLWVINIHKIFSDFRNFICPNTGNAGQALFRSFIITFVLYLLGLSHGERTGIFLLLRFTSVVIMTLLFLYLDVNEFFVKNFSSVLYIWMIVLKFFK